MKQNANLKQTKLIQVNDKYDTYSDSSSSEASSDSEESSSEKETSIFIIDPDLLPPKSKTVKTRTESGKKLRIRVYDDVFKAQLFKLYELDDINPAFDDGLVFESGETRKERRQAEKSWNKTLLKLNSKGKPNKNQKSPSRTKKSPKKSHKVRRSPESHACPSSSHYKTRSSEYDTCPHPPSSTETISEIERQHRIDEIIGMRTGKTKLTRNTGLRQGYQPNSHTTVLNETCIKPLLKFR